MEHRRFTRIQFDAVLQIYDPESKITWASELIDISLKGLKSARPIDWAITKHTHFETTLILAKNDIEIKLETNLVHFDEAILGFQIIHIDMESASYLHRLLELNLGDSTLLDREYSELISPSIT